MMGACRTRREMPMSEPLVLSALYRYPVKSLRGQSCERLALGPRGPLHDREWMLVDAEGRFLTQRQMPRMALVDTELSDDALVLRAPGMPELRVRREAGGERLPVQIWNDRCEAEAVGPEADTWLGEFLETECRLVHFPDDEVRQVDPSYARPGEQVGFADGFPLLLISQGSLDLLNRKLPEPVPMRRFRPNLVVRGCEPHAEDRWRRIRIGDIELRVVKPCSRCPIPGIDPDTGERRGRVLETLMTYRRGEDNKIYFGQNVLHDAEGELAVGMPVEILE